MKGMTTVLTAPDELEQRWYDLPDPGPGEMLLQMIRANVCGTEVHVVGGRHPLIGSGCVMGHEGVGRVLRLGSGVTTDSAGRPLAEGDRVVATYFQACRRCPECDKGKESLCRNAYAGWTSHADDAPHFHGTFGTHYSVGPHQNVYKVPDEVSSKAASSANCALSQAYAGCQTGEIQRGQQVLLLGAGGLGVCASAVANAMGAEVFVADLDPRRLKKAQSFGARHAIDLSTATTEDERVDSLRDATSGGADVVIDLTGTPTGFIDAVKSVAAGGILVSIGNIAPGRSAPFDPGAFTRSGTQIKASIRYPARVLGTAVDFIESTPSLPWEELVDADFALDDVQRAVQAARDHEVTRAGLIIE
jgi:D-arabinose 1-dehydrogenase-like Zn-dependent alcohol dehydrogenase